MTTNVLFIFGAKPELRERLRGRLGDADVRLIFPDEATPEEIAAFALEHAPHADVSVGWRPSAEFLAAAKNLKLHIFPGAGVQHLIEPFRKLNAERGVMLSNGHGNTLFTAEHAAALLLALTNRIVPHHNRMAAGGWRANGEGAPSIPLAGRRCGFLGYGSLGRKIHRILSGCGMEFHALRRDWNAGGPQRYENWTALDESLYAAVRKYTLEYFDKFLASVNVLFVALPLTPDTEGIIGERELKILGANCRHEMDATYESEEGRGGGALLVHVGRGKAVDEAALYRALRDGTIAGAGIDVWYDYSPQPDEAGRKFPYDAKAHPFHELENVVMSPHRAASPFGDLERWDEVIENLRRIAAGRLDILNMVDLERWY